MSEKLSFSELVKKKTVKVAAILATSALGLTGCSTAQPLKTPEHVITIDNKDSDGTTLPSGLAAIEDVTNEAFKQADELGITGESNRIELGNQSREATQEAIANDTTGTSLNLVGDNVSVTVRTDGEGRPEVAVIQVK